MAEKKMQNEELEKVAGGVLTDEDKQKIHAFSEELLKQHGSNCRECGKRYLKPNAMLPDAYGDFSLCPECNKKHGLGWEGRKLKTQNAFGDGTKD